MDQETELKTRLTRMFETAKRADAAVLADQFAPSLIPLFEKYEHLGGQNVMVMFSGGLDTSFITHFLTHVIGAHVTTVSYDLGSVTAPGNMDEVSARSREVGAAQHEAIDCRDQLAALGMDAVVAEAQLGNGHGHHPASSLSRVIISEEAVKYAKANAITAVFHGSNGSQNNPYRFHSALMHFQKMHGYEVEECTPNLGNTTMARDVQQAYLAAAGMSEKAKSFEDNVSHDRNLLGDEWEEERIANPANAYDVRRATALKDVPVPDAPLRIGIRFEKGRPVALKLNEGDDFKTMAPREMLETLNRVGLPYHLGIVDYPEGRPTGVRAREIHIAPAMQILTKAHNWLKAYQFDDYTNAKLNALSAHWSRWVMEKNMYAHPERKQMDRIFETFNADLNGEVNLTLEQGRITNIASPDAAMHAEGTKTPASAAAVDHYTQTTYAPDVDAKVRTEHELRKFVANLPEEKRPQSPLRAIQLMRRERGTQYDGTALTNLERLEMALHRLDGQDVATTLTHSP